jgi:hypothetical protein
MHVREFARDTAARPQILTQIMHVERMLDRMRPDDIESGFIAVLATANPGDRMPVIIEIIPLDEMLSVVEVR